MNILVLGTSASAKKGGYLKYFFSSLKNKSSQCPSVINYSLGDTSSMIGCFFLKNNEIKSSTNLVIIDFCINDRELFRKDLIDETIIAKSIEGMILLIRTKASDCEIIICNMTSCKSEFIQSIKKSECVVSNVYKKICNHYRISFINIAGEIITKYGDSFFKTLYEEGDLYHPSEPYGAKIIGETFYHLYKGCCRKKYFRYPASIINADNYSDLRVLRSPRIQKYIKGSCKVLKNSNSLISETFFQVRKKTY